MKGYIQIMPLSMSRKRKMLYIKKPAVIFGTVLAMVFGGAVFTAPPAFAVGHTCVELGSYNGVEGDVCVDLIAYWDPDTPVYVATAELTGICQTGGTEVQCAGISIAGAASDPSSAGQNSFNHCGHQYPACGPQRTYFYSLNANIQLSQYPNGCAYNLWAVVFKGTSIQLPGAGADHAVTLGANVATPHYNLGGSCII
jgi:hypothetical protein